MGEGLRHVSDLTLIEMAAAIHIDIVFGRPPIPREKLDAMVAYRREAFRRGLDLQPVLRWAAARHTGRTALEQQLRNIDRRIAMASDARSNTRASATSKAARLAQLAKSRDGIVEQLGMLDRNGE